MILDLVFLEVNGKILIDFSFRTRNLWITVNCKVCTFIQGYPQRMRLQSRLHRINSCLCALYLWFSETKNWFLLLANYNKQCEKKIFKADELISCLSLLIDSSGEWGLWILGGGNGVDAIDNVQENYFYFIRNTRRSMNISASIFLHV